MSIIEANEQQIEKLNWVREYLVDKRVIYNNDEETFILANTADNIEYSASVEVGQFEGEVTFTKCCHSPYNILASFMIPDLKEDFFTILAILNKKQ